MNLSKLFAPDEGRDALRTLAGLLLGLGFFMTFARKSGIGEPWGNWGLFVTLLIITAFLWAVGIIGRLSTPTARRWQSVYLVFAIVLTPFLLFQFVDAIGGAAGSDLNAFWIFLVTAAAAAVAALLADVRYALLLASISVILSLSSLWDKILSNGLIAHYGIYRGLLVLYGLLLLACAFAVYRFDPLARFRPGGVKAPEPERWLRAQDVVTGAAIAGVAAGAITFTAFFAQTGSIFVPPVASPSLLWDIELLVASLLAVLWGTRFAVRGPTYIGAIGLFIFVVDVGSEVGIDTPEATIVGWPLILVILGAVFFGASLVPDVTAPDVEATLREGGTGGGPGPTGVTGPPARGGPTP